MNIFFVDKDPAKAAQALVDKHVVKMILESAQLLSTAHRVLDGEKKTGHTKTGRKCTLYKLYDNRDLVLYKATHINHPSAVWVRESVENYNWLVEHLLSLLDEYTFRYNKKHKCWILVPYIIPPPFNLKNWDRTPVKLAMPDEYKVDDPVESYRNYYRGAKQDLFDWKNRERPDWL